MIEEEPDHLSAEEVRVIVSQLAPADASNILKAARWFSARCGIPEEDLRQEALARLLAGERHVRRNFNFGKEIGGIIKSIAWDEIEAVRAGRREVRPPPDGISAPDLADPSLSPETLVLSACADGAMLAKIGRLIEDDEELQLLVEGICDKMKGEELQELLGVDVQGLAAARRRLKRRLQGALSEGIGTMNGKDAERMAQIDDLMLEEIFSDDADDIEEGAVEAIRLSLEGAELALRKRRLAQIKAQIDKERKNPVVIPVDADRMRAKLQSAANDPEMKMTLAARNAVEDGNDEEEGLLEDLAELEQDEASRKK